MNFIYPQNRPDLYFQLLNESQYNDQLNILTNRPEESYLGFDENAGFIHFSSLGMIYEIVKGFFGFGNQTDQTRVEAEWLKFLYYGEARGFLTEQRLTSLRNRLYCTNLPLMPSVAKLFRKILRQHRTPHPERLARMRAVLINYHTQNQPWLAPHLWFRIFHTPGEQQPLVHFGDTALQLAEKALNLPQRDVPGAFKHLLHAFHLKNTHPDFQRKFALQFKSFIAGCRTEEALTGQREQIQKIWIELARTSYRNQRPEEAREYLDEVLADQPVQEVKNQIGETYLVHQDFSKMEPFLPALQQGRSNNSVLLIQIGMAFWHYQRYAEAVSAKQEAIQLLSSVESKQAAASLHSEIGQAYFQRLAGLDTQDSLTKAIHHFQKAHQLENSPHSESCLLSAYLRQWQEAPASFPRLFGWEWLQLVRSCSPRLLDENQAPFIEIILASADEAFRTNQKQLAQTYLQQGIAFYQNKDAFALKALEQCLKFNHSVWLRTKLYELENQYAGHPRIQKRLGEIHWAADRNHAIALFNHAIPLFELEKSRALQEEVKAECSLHLAEMHAKIGENHLHSPQGVFHTINYPEVLVNLEKAAQFNRGAYAQPLFEAYLKAAEAEKNKTFITRDWEKAMLYSSKAFKIAPQNGPYLVELMDHYLAKDIRHSEALQLFISIQALPWSEAAPFTAKQLDKLAPLLFKQGEHALSQKCREKALQMEPANGEYKKRLCQLVLSLCKTKQAKAVNLENNEKKMAQLLEVAASLEDQIQKGFSKIEDLRGETDSILAETYWLLANAYKEELVLGSGYNKEELRKHQSRCALRIPSPKAIDYYDKAIAIQPENPIFYFEKGMVLDFLFQKDNVLENFRLAVKYSKQNPFYRQKLAFAYGLLSNSEKNKTHEDKLKEILAVLTVSLSEFYKAYSLWDDEYFVKIKTQSTDPHKD